MKVEPGLSQKILTREYVYAVGYRSRDAATLAIWDAMSEGLICAAERPREVSYCAASGTQRWAIVLEDSTLAPL